MREASIPAQSDIISDELVALAGNEAKTVDTGEPVTGRNRVGLHDTYRQPALEWRGPVSFASAYGSIPGIDHDFGMRWGSNRDQRVSLRVELGCEEGLLYVYDPTWDEYAVIGTEVSLAALQTGFARALHFGEHGAVADFVALLPNVPPVRLTLGPEL